MSHDDKTRPLEPQADAWVEICGVLDEVRPGWDKGPGKHYVERATNAIRALSAARAQACVYRSGCNVPERCAAEERCLALKPDNPMHDQAPASSERATYQGRVGEFVLACFGPIIATDKKERNHRFLEEALELVQAIGCTASEAHQLVDYVYGRPTGEAHAEVGGVLTTLAALCNANRLDMEQAGEDELKRVWGRIDIIREKQRNKPKHSPLPEVAPNSASGWRKCVPDMQARPETGYVLSKSIKYIVVFDGNEPWEFELPPLPVDRAEGAAK